MSAPLTLADATSQAIAHAVVAGRLRAVARARPDCARGLLKAAGLHSAKATGFAGHIHKLSSAGRG